MVQATFFCMILHTGLRVFIVFIQLLRGLEVRGCSLVAVLKPATSKGAPLTTTLTCGLSARVVDKSDQRMCHQVSLNAKGSLRSCIIGKRRVPCRLVSVMSPKCGCGMFRFRHSFLGTCSRIE